MSTTFYIIIAVVVIIFGIGGYMFMGKSKGGISSSCKRATQDRIGVFCIGKNIFRYVEAKDIAEKFGARIASVQELDAACRSGCNWNTLGWCQDFGAYICRNGKLQGGVMPGQLKLGVYCYGFKPMGKEADDLLII